MTARKRGATRALSRLPSLALLTAILVSLSNPPARAQGSEAPVPTRAPAAATPAYATSTRVDWKARILSIDVSLDLAAAGLRLPEGRLEAQRMLEKDLPGLAKDAVFSLQADSYRTIEDTVADGSLDSQALVALSGLAKEERSSFSKDMRRFLATYTLSLDEVTRLFVTGVSPSPIRAPLESRPTRAYTGIIVYAKGPLPVHGEAVVGEAKPCLFPRVYDSEMHLVLDKSMVLPEALEGEGGPGEEGGGVLGYASGLGVEAGERVGTDPLRVMALELFGDGRTDYIISREDALRILSSAGNRELLRRGRVVAVVDLE